MIGFLIVGGTSALASNGSHRATADAQASGRLAATRATVVQAPAPGSSAALPNPRPVKVRTFATTWLSSHLVQDPPAINGRAAMVLDVNSGQILYARDVHTRYPDASLTKMMTAMVALDLASLDQVLTVPEPAIKVEPSVMGLTAGEQLSLRELLHGLLLDSGNDAAEAIARGITDRAQFVQRMNQKAGAMRLGDTRFANPAGADQADQFSSAYDLAAIAVTLLQDYPELGAIVGTSRVSIPATSRHKWFGPQNLNRLLGSYPGALGVKPGFTDAAGYCMAAAATRQGRTVVAVVLGSTQHFTDARALLDFGFRHPVTGS